MGHTIAGIGAHAHGVRFGTYARPEVPPDDQSGKPLLILNRVTEMPRNIYVLLYALTLTAVVVGVDLLFFRNRLWERLIVNVGIVLVFAAFYLRFLKNP